MQPITAEVLTEFHLLCFCPISCNRRSIVRNRAGRATDHGSCWSQIAVEQEQHVNDDCDRKSDGDSPQHVSRNLFLNWSGVESIPPASILAPAHLPRVVELLALRGVAPRSAAQRSAAILPHSFRP